MTVRTTLAPHLRRLAGPLGGRWQDSITNGRSQGNPVVHEIPPASPELSTDFESVGQILGRLAAEYLETHETPRPKPRRLHWSRFAYVLPWLAVAGGFLCIGQLLIIWSKGGWPPHDTSAYWLAGMHLREGAAIYAGSVGGFLAFLYGPPWAVLSAVASFVPLYPLAALLMAGQVVALRYVVGSWVAVGLIVWLPPLTGELFAGNVNLIMAAVILAGARRERWSGPLVALFAFAKFSPVLVLSRATWRGALIAGVILLAITLPWWHLWPEWIGQLTSEHETGASFAPLFVRVPLALALMAVRKPWATAAAAGLASPTSAPALLLPAVRLAWR